LGIDKSKLNPNLYSSKYLNALAVLGIENKNSSLDEIKTHFKKIVKELHPDTVGNNKNNTEKLTKVLESYKILKEYYEQFKRPTK
jgi:curved DNA-binding protein CbpA